MSEAKNITALVQSGRETFGDLKEFYPALIKARKSFGKALKKGENKYQGFSYVKLEQLMEACEIALLDNDLILEQAVISEPFLGVAGCETILTHASGAGIKHLHVLPIGKQEPQGVGTAQTYARRYALMGLLGIAPTEDDGDDDGVATIGNDFNPEEILKPAVVVADPLTDETLNAMTEVMERRGWKLEVVLQKLGYQKLSDIPEKRAQKWLAKVAEVEAGGAQ